MTKCNTAEQDLLTIAYQLIEVLDVETSHLLQQDVLEHAHQIEEMVERKRVLGDRYLHSVDQWVRRGTNSGMSEKMMLILKELHLKLRQNENALRAAIEVSERYLRIVVEALEDNANPATTYNARGYISHKRAPKSPLALPLTINRQL